MFPRARSPIVSLDTLCVIAGEPRAGVLGGVCGEYVPGAEPPPSLPAPLAHNLAPPVRPHPQLPVEPAPLWPRPPSHLWCDSLLYVN